MRGKVLGFDFETGEGVISGDDGNRYTVRRSGLGAGVRVLIPGRTVDFIAENDTATGVYPIAGDVMGEKNKWVAAILAFMLGAFGVHKFYLGRTNAGLIMLVVFLVGIIFVLPALIIGIIAFIESIIYMIKSDEEFHEDYVVGDRAWF